MKTSISLMPDYSRTDLWLSLIKQMLYGHNKHIRAQIHKIEAMSPDKKLEFFKAAGEYAAGQIEFYQSIKEIAEYEYQIENKKNYLETVISRE